MYFGKVRSEFLSKINGCENIKHFMFCNICTLSGNCFFHRRRLSNFLNFLLNKGPVDKYSIQNIRVDTPHNTVIDIPIFV